MFFLFWLLLLSSRSIFLSLNSIHVSSWLVYVLCSFPPPVLPVYFCFSPLILFQMFSWCIFISFSRIRCCNIYKLYTPFTELLIGQLRVSKREKEDAGEWGREREREKRNIKRIKGGNPVIHKRLPPLPTPAIMLLLSLFTILELFL